MDSSQASKPKPFFIELFAADQSLQNKYKFTFQVKTVKDLKTALHDKLVAKSHIAADSKLVLKDVDDYELASDDEVQQVIADGKIRVYQQQNKPIQAPPVFVPPVVVPATNVQPATVVIPPSSQPVVPLNPPVTLPTIKDSILDLSSFAIPAIAQGSITLNIYIPQIRKSPYKLSLPSPLPTFTFNSFSSYIINAFNLPSNLKALIYNRYGQPLLYNLDLFQFEMEKLTGQDYWVILTKSQSSCDLGISQPQELGDKKIQISVLFEGKKHKVQIDLVNTVEVLKYKVYQLTKIHPSNQILKFGSTVLLNPFESLLTFNLIPSSILTLSFKSNSNFVPASYSDKFYYKDIKHIHTPTDEALEILRANLMILVAQLNQDDKLKMSAFLLGWTGNLPLVYAFKLLIKNSFVSQSHRIALEEGLFVAVVDYLRACNPSTDTPFNEVFKFTREFFGFAIQTISKLNAVTLKQLQATVEIQRCCHFTMKPIVTPRIIKLDNGQFVIVDKELMQEQILKGFTYDLLKKPKIEDLTTDAGMQQMYRTHLFNMVQHTTINSLFWKGFNPEGYPALSYPDFGAFSKYLPQIDTYPNLKVHQPLQVKNKNIPYLLLRTKQDKLRVFISRNKDINKPYNIFSVLTGQQEAVNFDLMGANVKSQNVQQVIDISNLKAVITREPKEAIAVLFDISGSMGSYFFNEKDLKRIGAVKSFFEAFAYRTVAYNLEHVVSLTFFDDKLQNQCGFTQAIYDFNRLISSAKPRGSTLMYDAIAKAVEELVEFKLKYPGCILRILALTDGEDSGSRTSIPLATKLVVENGIIMDSFAVGANCEGLKIVTKATGGKCYLTRNLQQSLKLFEQETVLSVRSRKLQKIQEKQSIQTLIERARLKPFDLVGDCHEFKLPQVNQPGLSAKQMAVKMQNQQQVKKISGSGSLKRIAKQIQNYSQNPHPFVAIYPCSNINIWKILLLGPKETPYENGLFLLYAQFPGDYPFKAPEVRFITPIYHCNMNSQGRICHSVFDRNYSPALTFRQIIDCVYGLILTPEPEDPLDNVIASFYLSDYQTYLKNAKQATKEKASPTVQKIVDELFGKIADDIQKKQKQKQIEEWIKLAKSFN